MTAATITATPNEIKMTRVSLFFGALNLRILFILSLCGLGACAKALPPNGWSGVRLNGEAQSFGYAWVCSEAL
jgi:hypothetical protein